MGITAETDECPIPFKKDKSNLIISMAELNMSTDSESEESSGTDFGEADAREMIEKDLFGVLSENNDVEKNLTGIREEGYEDSVEEDSVMQMSTDRTDLSRDEDQMPPSLFNAKSAARAYDDKQTAKQTAQDGLINFMKFTVLKGVINLRIAN